MKIAVPTRNGAVDDHFGHCESYTIYTIENNEIVNSEMLASPAGCGCKSDIAPTLVKMGVKVLLAGNMGSGALNMLNSVGIDVVRGCSGNVEELIHAYLAGRISDGGEGCHEHGNCNHN